MRKTPANAAPIPRPASRPPPSAVFASPVLAVRVERTHGAIIMNAARDALKRQYGELFNSISLVLFEADPIGINFEINTDEYEPEVGTIIPRLSSAQSAEDVQAIIYEEFCHWFGPDAIWPRENYAAVSEKIWTLWCNFLRPSSL